MSGHVIHLTGISGSGKTTLGLRLRAMLEKKSCRPVEFIDGDVVRRFLEIDSGFTQEERNVVTKQIAYAAHVLAGNGIDVIVSNIAGSYAIRDYLRRTLKNYVQIFLDAEIEDCKKNDFKGVYKLAETTEKPNICGVDIKYDRPRNPDVVVYPYKEDVEVSLRKVMEHLDDRNFFEIGATK